MDANRRPTDTQRFDAAVREFWAIRAKQRLSQAERGGSDQGARSEATGGKQMLGFELLVLEGLQSVGVTPADVYLGRSATLPGYYRPVKDWDFVVQIGGELLAALELKAHIGPSFGNNANNRVEEALGNAVDLLAAHDHGAFGTQPRPWLGYLLIVEDCAESRAPIRATTLFPVDSTFLGSSAVQRGLPILQDPASAPTKRSARSPRRSTITVSYIERYVTLCRRLREDGFYASTALIAAVRDPAPSAAAYSAPADLRPDDLLTSLARHVENRLKN